MKDFKGSMMIMGGGMLWGLSGTAAKTLLNENVDTLLLVQTRVTFSFLLLMTFYLLMRPEYLRVRAKDLYRFALLGTLGVAGSNFTYYFTIRESTVASAILMQYMAPLLVMVYGAVTREDQFTLVKLAAACVSVLGCFLALGAYDAGVLRISGTALVSGVGSMLSFAFLNIYTRRLVAKYSAWTVVFYSLAFASLMWLVVNPPWVAAAHAPEPRLWGVLVLFAVMSILLPHTLYFSGLRYIVPSRAIITSTIEPVVAIVSAAIVLGERMQLLQMVGAFTVLAAIVLLQLRSEPTVLDTRNMSVPGNPDAAQ